MEKQGSLARQFFLLFLATVAAFLIVLKLDLPGRLAYSVEKARLKAVQESLPKPDQVSEAVENVRRLTRTVAPAVVSITTAQRVTRDGRAICIRWETTSAASWRRKSIPPMAPVSLRKRRPMSGDIALLKTRRFPSRPAWAADSSWTPTGDTC